MKQFLLYLTKISGYKMKNFLIPVLFSMISNFASAQTSGIYESYAILSINGGSDIYFDMQASTGNPDLNGNNLGSFIYGLNSLVVKGGENKTFKNSGCNINSGAILFRIYLTGSPSGSFTNIAESFISDDGGGNQTWRSTTGTTNNIDGLSPGSYTLEVYSQAGYDSCGSGTHLSNNGGANYMATFTIVKAESTIAVAGTTSFTYNNTPQGPSDATVTGSTGVVTYSYVGVSPTIYAANATPPTNPGTYTVTATVASDDNYNGASSSATPFIIGASTYIPDNNFLLALINPATYNITHKDNYVLTSEISGITELDVSGLGIANLAGIEDFSSLLDLYCADNALSSLNVSMLSNLRYLDCQNNALTSLNITGLNNLTQMVCWVNNLTTLDLSSTPNLVYLDCDDNLFTSLNVSGLTKLVDFYCSGNSLTSLDVRGLTSLAYFECTSNPSLPCILVDNLAVAIASESAGDWAKDASANYSYCSCSLPITWDGTAWSNGTGPTSETDAIIAGDYSESANISACSLTINDNAVVVIPSGKNVTLNAPIIVNSGSFTLENNANLIQTNKNSINSGAITVKRNSNSLYRLDYTMWSSPVANQNLLNFSPLTTVTPDSRFLTYNSATDFYNSIVDPSALAFEKGFGYLIRMPNTDPTSGYDAGTTSIAYPGVFTGLPNNGDVTLAVSSGTYNAIGNPYSSTISADDFITDNGITEALYFWRKTNNVNQATAPTTSYATYTFAGGTGTGLSNTAGGSSIVPNGTIQVGQGFIAKSTSSTLKFTNTMRTANNSNQILKTKAVERNRVWVNLTNSAGVFSQMMVAYMPGATQDIDAAIDGRYFNDSPMALNSLINSEEFAIQGRALPFDGTDIVPLAFKTNLAGEYTISIDHVDGLFSGNQEVYLKDNNTGTEIDLKAGSYTFTAASGVDNARFSLKYQKTLKVDATVFNDNSVVVYKNKGILYVNSAAVAIANIKVFDIQGRLIAEQKNVKSNSATIKDLKAFQQVLIVKITSQDNKIVSKKVVN